MNKRILVVVVALCVLSAIFMPAQQPPPPPHKVFVAGTGNPDRLPDVLAGLSGCLADKGITAKHLGPVPKTRGVALEEMKQKGGSYLFFVSLDFTPRGNIPAHLTMESFNNTRKALWEESIDDSMVVTSQPGEIRKMVNDACKKLETHVGGEGLPKDAHK